MTIRVDLLLFLGWRSAETRKKAVIKIGVILNWRPAGFSESTSWVVAVILESQPARSARAPKVVIPECRSRESVVAVVLLQNNRSPTKFLGDDNSNNIRCPAETFGNKHQKGK